MTYEFDKRTTKEDVKREGREAVAAVKAVLGGEGTLAQAEAEAIQAAQAAADLVGDSLKDAVAGVKRYFRSTLGYQLHDPEQDVHVLPHVDTPAVETQWVKDRIAEGTVKEVFPDTVVVAEKPAE